MQFLGGSMSARVIASRVLVLVLAVAILASPQTTSAKPRSKPYNPVPAGWPRVLMIPRISVRANVEAIALKRGPDFKAPYKWGDVAWYNSGPRPGDRGHANIFGHLDSTCCPAVFWYLKSLVKGNTVGVTYRNGKTLWFRVLWRATYWNRNLPLKFMFGPAKQRGLILMTCAGAFHLDGTGYDHKLLVYAKFIG